MTPPFSICASPTLTVNEDEAFVFLVVSAMLEREAKSVSESADVKVKDGRLLADCRTDCRSGCLAGNLASLCTVLQPDGEDCFQPGDSRTCHVAVCNQIA